MPEPIRLPNSKQRLAVIGRTGSGKTVAALWHLSNANFDAMPWIVVDFKTDENINAIEGAKYITTSDNPKSPGIYIIQPEPDDPAMFDFLTRIWQRENTGIYIDEGYMIGENRKTEQRFKTLLTQGRSKRIPMIVLSQRPAWISRFVWSESDFFQVFDLSMEDDIVTIHRMLPKGSFIPLPDFHSIYYDVGKKRISYLAPVPDVEEIIEKINARLKPIRKRI
jgi:DNA helicase HerA-like ATPase